MDGVLCDFDKGMALHKGTKYPQTKESFWVNLSPIEGAIEAVKELAESNEVWILTAPSLKNPACYSGKRIWVEQNLGFDFVERLIICPNKGLLNGDILIDDNKEGRGQEYFDGVLVHFGGDAYKNWNDILKVYGEKEEYSITLNKYYTKDFTVSVRAKSEDDALKLAYLKFDHHKYESEGPMLLLESQESYSVTKK